MPYENVLVEREGNIAILTINRPKLLNALNDATVAEIGAAIDELGADPNVGAVIITGAGERAFVSGADINELRAMSGAPQAEAKVAASQAVCNKVERLPKPVIAAINGFALGGGCELAMSCDIRIAADSARLGQPEINLGIIPGMGGTQRLPRLVGKGWAKYLDLSGEFIDADTALRIGLVEKVVPAAELLTAAKDLAGKLASKAPLAVAAVKKAINDGMEVDLDRGLAIEAAQFAIASVTEDRVEGTSAFLEKRKPRWKGK